MGVRAFHYLKILIKDSPHTALSNARPENTAKTEETGGQPRPPVFSYRFPQRYARASAGRITATAIPTGASFPHTASPSAGNCHGAEPTLFPALLPAADNRPTASRGGPPSRRQPTTPLCQQQNPPLCRAGDKNGVRLAQP